jgi:lipid-binding SYLF domain-containing protein
MKRRNFFAGLTAASIIVCSLASGNAIAGSAAEMNAAADATISLLKKSEPVTDEMIANAKGVLIFPKIVKGGLIVGAAVGDGVLRVDGQTAGYYRSTAVSYGFLAGVAKFGYVMFLMDDESLAYARDTQGWELGVGPNLTIADKGFATKFSTTTVDSGIYVFFVDQEGFFAGGGIEGTKISRIAK